MNIPFPLDKRTKVNVSCRTHMGQVRSRNEDSIACMDPEDPRIRARGHLMLVADGLGGHSRGDVASRIISEELPRMYYASEHLESIACLEEALDKVNDVIYQKSQSDEEFQGMASTLAACVVIGNNLVAMNIGDSRIYLLNGARFLQVSEDHLRVATSMLTGRKKQLLTRAVGAAEEVIPSISVHKIEEGDTILLCSDGLTGEVRDEEIKEILAGKDMERVADRLVEAANDNGGHDNISVIVARLVEMRTENTPAIQADTLEGTHAQN